MTARMRNQDGWAVATAMILMGIMLTIGLAAFAFADAETQSSRKERTQESRLNLTEGVVAAELFQLSRNWPTSTGFPDCTQDSSALPCPSATQIKSHFSGVDFKLNPTWSIKVRDNADVSGATCDQPTTPGFYDDATILSKPHYDANQDCQLWVRAEGQLKGRKRVVVAQVRIENRPVNFPDAPFVAGAFQTANNSGSKTIVNSGDKQGLVRCDNSAYGGNTNNDCINYTGGQISPVGSVRSDFNVGDNALDPSMIEALRAMAKSKGTWYQNCPANPSGDIVFVESGNCSYNASTPGPVNGATKKGIFVIYNGTFSLSGNLEWYGAIYAVNAQGCSPTNTTNCLTVGSNHDVVVDASGTGTIHGAIFVDGSGRLSLGASGNAGNSAGSQPNLVYDPTVISSLRALGTAGIIQNTWRELTNG